MSDDVRGKMLGLFGEPARWLAPGSAIEQKVGLGLTRFLEDKERPGSPPLEGALAEFSDTRLPEEPRPVEDYVDHLLADIVPRAVKTSAPQFIGHMTSALPGYVHLLGKLVTALNQNVVKVETSGAMTLYERQALAMLHRLVYAEGDAFYATHAQRKESTLGMMVSGGTLGNLAALWCARNAALGPAADFAGVESAGLAAALEYYGYEGAVVVGSSLMHYSMDKAADVLGLGTAGVLRVPAGESGRVDAEEVARTVEACRRRRECVVAVVGVAGSTEVGSIDPLPELAAVAAQADVHFHVDAAWGGPVLFSSTHRHKLAGIERADSVTIDGHKQLYLPVGIGSILFRDPELARHIERVANYVARAHSRDLGKRTLEGTRPGASLYLHAALSIVGRRGFEWLVDNGIDKTQYLERAIERRPEFELLSAPELNILAYRYLPARERERVARGGRPDNHAINEVNRRLQELEFAEGTGFVSRTLLTNTRYGPVTPVVALRAVLANPLTTEADLDAVLDEQVRLGAHVEAEQGLG